jgi:hypothetical protein
VAIIYVVNNIPPLGIIMLDTEFARPLGDAGNPASWPFPVLIERVPRAYAKDVVSGQFENIPAFVNIARLLRANGAISIISTCGFLARIARTNWVDIDCAVLTSTLFKFNELQATLPRGKRVAILTIDRESFDDAIFANCDIPRDAIIVSPPRDGHFCRAILEQTEPLDVALAEQELVRVAIETQRAHPEIGLWLFECANMPPYRDAVERVTGVPVYDVLHMGIALHAEAMRSRESSSQTETT